MLWHCNTPNRPSDIRGQDLQKGLSCAKTPTRFRCSRHRVITGTLASGLLGRVAAHHAATQTHTLHKHTPQRRQRVRAPGRHLLGRHGLQGRGLRRDHRSNANIQQRLTRPLPGDARSRNEATAAIESKIAGYRAALGAPQPLHQVRGADLRIVRVDGPHRAEAGQRVRAADRHNVWAPTGRHQT